MKPEQFHAALQNLIVDMDDPFADEPAEVMSVTEVCDYLMGQVIQGLIEEGKEETAAMMLSCRLDLEVKEQRSGTSLLPTIHGPISILKQLQERQTHYDENGYMVGPYNVNLETFTRYYASLLGLRLK